MILWVKHKATAHHWRHNRKGGSIIGTCRCGYRSRLFRRIRRHKFLYGFVCKFKGHVWEVADAEIGPPGFEDGEAETYISGRQCERCYRTETVTKRVEPEWEGSPPA